jgi:pimeloyl-ACP methyl ester carboxylesterase
LRSKLIAATALAVLGSVVPAASAAPALTACPGQRQFRCGTLPVPLDHTGAVPGTVDIHFAVQSGGPAPLVIALSGGPGQSAVSSASSLALTLAPALRRYHIAVLDQRGTGDSGVLDCPTVQHLRSLDAFQPAALAACAARIGPRRAFYSTADTVLDIEALRVALGAPKVALMGISYGTHVALEYARAFPANVDKLILDSVVGPDDPDPFLLDTYRNFPRVLDEQCSRDRCRGITNDPVADVAALASRINTRGALRGSYFNAAGQRVTTSFGTPDELSFLLTAGDLNPFLQAALPAALSAARLGDPALLMRLRPMGQGGPTAEKDLSFGLNVTTGCEDVALPYPLVATPIADRPAVAQAALAAIPPANFGPFDPQTVLRTSYADDCLQWPGDPNVLPSFNGPLPNVPALLLGGRLDTRTPIENAFETHAQLPESTVVALRGSGHDALDSDVTGCTAQALRRFVNGVPVGQPCAGRDNGVRPFPLPPTALAQFRSAPGVGGDRGRKLFATLASIDDARLSTLQALFGGLPTRGGGLRGGSYSASDALDGTLRLRRYSYLAGLRVSGDLKVVDARIRGTVRVSGRATGTITIDRRGNATGVLEGKRVHFSASAAARTASLRADGARWPRLAPLSGRRPLAAR